MTPAPAPTPAIRPAREDELAAVGALVALSFNDLDANAYLVPPLADRLRVMGDFFTLYTEHAFRHGRVDVIDGRSGGLDATAVWFDRTAEMPEPPEYGSRLAALSGQYLGHFDALDELFDKHHPVEPHWHLAFLAVHPDQQHRGLGGALMSRTHDELDRAGVPEYLEATNENNIRLYRRYDYRDMIPFDILLPDGTPFYRMWRPASA
jgi:ribosomal protein S18 acetylase RimI-like enzyme